MAQNVSFRPVSPALVAVVGWLVPGAGYWLLGQRTRALTIGLTIMALFLLGLLVGGIRELEVPGYGASGKPVRVSSRTEYVNGHAETVYHLGDDVEEGPLAVATHPMDEIRSKPWAIPQIMVGPLDVLCSIGSVRASEYGGSPPHPLGTRSHSHTNEIGVLYTAVAGMLNLLAIIDSAYRAGRSGP